MRTPDPWYRASKDAWYVELNGKQIRLAKGKENRDEAMQAFYRRMADGPAALASEKLAVATVCDLFLSWSEKHHKQSTYEWNRHFLDSFVNFERLAHLPAAKLKPLHVTRWLDAHPSWDGGRVCAVTVVKRAFNWAESEGLLEPNPLRKLKKPAARSRDRVLSAGEKKEILAAVKGECFRTFITAMQETGCRPGEVASVEAGHVDLNLGVWVLKEHKTGKKTGRPRIVYLTPGMLTLTKELMAKRPTGRLFLNSRGRPWTKNAVRIRFRNLRKKLPHLGRFYAYAYRHSYAGEALVNGVGVAQVAELLGHADTKMVMRHYSHLSQKIQHMKEAARKAAAVGDGSEAATG